MPRVETEVTISAPLQEVWQMAQDVEKLPGIMPDLESVKVLEREERSPGILRVVSEWRGRIKQFNRTIAWTEEDIWNHNEKTCHFWQINGDFADYKGEWRFSDDGSSGTRAYLLIEYKFEIPLLGAVMGKVIQKLMQENCDGMLGSLRDEAQKRNAAGAAPGAPVTAVAAPLEAAPLEAAPGASQTSPAPEVVEAKAPPAPAPSGGRPIDRLKNRGGREG